MDERYFSLLPVSAKTFVEEIERVSGISIDVRPVDVTWVKREIGEHAEAETFLRTYTANPAAIIGFRGEELAPDALVHEILHLHRLWVRQVCCLTFVRPTRQANREHLSAICNDVEHLFVIPEETNILGYTRPKWKKELHSPLPSHFFSKGIPEQRMAASVRWFVAQHIFPKKYSESDLWKKLRQRGLHSQARAFAMEAQALIDDLPALYRKAVEYAKLKPGLFNLKVTDIARRQELMTPLALPEDD